MNFLVLEHAVDAFVADISRLAYSLLEKWMSSAPTKTSPCVQDIDSKEAQYYEAISECSNSYLMRTLKSLEIADDEEIVNVGLEDEFE